MVSKCWWIASVSFGRFDHSGSRRQLYIQFRAQMLKASRNRNNMHRAMWEYCEHDVRHCVALMVHIGPMNAFRKEGNEDDTS